MDFSASIEPIFSVAIAHELVLLLLVECNSSSKYFFILFIKSIKFNASILISKIDVLNINKVISNILLLVSRKE